MPCRDYYDLPGSVQYKDRPETVQMLCSALTALEKAGVPIPKNCVRWWEAHKREDAARVKAERERLLKEDRKMEILKSLSEEDKKILGLK